LSDSSYGELRDLVREIGIHPDNMEFMNVGDLQKKRDQLMTQPSDQSFSYLMNALFTPLDMTDYESNFVGFNEIAGGLPIEDAQLLRPAMEELLPATHALASIEPIENRPQYARSKTHREYLETKAAEAEAAADEEEEEEEEGGEEEGEESEGEEEAAEEEEDEDGKSDGEWPPKDRVAHPDLENRYFVRGENLRNKFNEIELDSFMKLLNVKPFKQW
jgi:hypothetical protein